jgi:hypothetical protein
MLSIFLRLLKTPILKSNGKKRQIRNIDKTQRKEGIIKARVDFLIFLKVIPN